VKITVSADPDRKELALFLKETVNLLGFLVNAEDFRDRLWRGDENLRQLGAQSFEKDVIPAAKNLESALHNISPDDLKYHGLTGTAARFKYKVIAKLARAWRRHKGEFTVGKTLRSLLEAVDAVLDSMVSAANGNGGLIKEFKDVIMALASAR
jgi:molecular chaperone GrpE (heat shock protein)